MCNVQAVIITYYADLKVVNANVEELLQDRILSAIHIIDNTPSETDLMALASDRVNVRLLGDNKGIAYAQNIGIQIALDSDADYIVLFDQDSSLKSDLVSGLLVAMQEAKKAQIKLACIGPRPLDVFSGNKSVPKIQLENKINSHITLCSQIIASGKLINVDALRDVGVMEDSLFIDGVDHEWCWRAKKQGYQVAIAEQVVMKHELGDARDSLLGIKYKIDSPIRMYYQFRNILVLARRGYVPLYWKLRCISGIFFRILVFGIIRKDSHLRRKYIWQGLIDGVIKRMGAYNPR